VEQMINAAEEAKLCASREWRYFERELAK